MIKMNYNFVYLGSDADFMRISFGDMEKVAWAKYLCRRIDSGSAFLTKLYQLHTSPKTNRLFRLPGQRIWNRMMFRGSFAEKSRYALCSHRVRAGCRTALFRI